MIKLRFKEYPNGAWVDWSQYLITPPNISKRVESDKPGVAGAIVYDDANLELRKELGNPVYNAFNRDLSSVQRYLFEISCPNSRGQQRKVFEGMADFGSNDEPELSNTLSLTVKDKLSAMALLEIENARTYSEEVAPGLWVNAIEYSFTAGSGVTYLDIRYKASDGSYTPVSTSEAQFPLRRGMVWVHPVDKTKHLVLSSKIIALPAGQNQLECVLYPAVKSTGTVLKYSNEVQMQKYSVEVYGVDIGVHANSTLYYGSAPTMTLLRYDGIKFIGALLKKQWPESVLVNRTGNSEFPIPLEYFEQLIFDEPFNTDPYGAFKLLASSMQCYMFFNNQGNLVLQGKKNIGANGITRSLGTTAKIDAAGKYFWDKIADGVSVNVKSWVIVNGETLTGKAQLGKTKPGSTKPIKPKNGIPREVLAATPSLNTQQALDEFAMQVAQDDMNFYGLRHGLKRATLDLDDNILGTDEQDVALGIDSGWDILDNIVIDGESYFWPKMDYDLVAGTLDIDFVAVQGHDYYPGQISVPYGDEGSSGGSLSNGGSSSGGSSPSSYDTRYWSGSAVGLDATLGRRSLGLDNIANIGSGQVSTAEFNYLAGLTGNIQTQLNALGHMNKAYLDTIDQSLGTGNSPTFAGLTLNGNLTVRGTGNSSFAGYLSVASYIDLTGALYVRDKIYVRNKANNGWLNFAARNLSGSEAVYDLANIGSITAYGNLNIYGGGINNFSGYVQVKKPGYSYFYANTNDNSEAGFQMLNNDTAIWAIYKPANSSNMYWWNPTYGNVVRLAPDGRIGFGVDPQDRVTMPSNTFIGWTYSQADANTYTKIGTSSSVLQFKQSWTSDVGAKLFSFIGNPANVETEIFNIYNDGRATLRGNLKIANTAGPRLVLSPYGVAGGTSENLLMGVDFMAYDDTVIKAKIDVAEESQNVWGTPMIFRTTLDNWSNNNLYNRLKFTTDRKTTLYDDYVGIGVTTFDSTARFFVDGNTKQFGDIFSDNYTGVDPYPGYYLGRYGSIFGKITANEMHVKSFIADLEMALAGSQIIAKSVAKLYQDFEVGQRLVVEEFEGFIGWVFETGDYVRLRVQTRDTGLTSADLWGTVSNPTRDDTTKTQSYTFNILSGSGVKIKKGSLAIDYGKSGNGIFEIVAVGPLGKTPFAQIATWNTAPYTDLKIISRFGDLTGVPDNIFGVLSGFGVYTQRMYLSSMGGDQNAITMIADNNTALLRLQTGGNTIFDFDTATATAKISGWKMTKDAIYNIDSNSGAQVEINSYPYFMVGYWQDKFTDGKYTVTGVIPEELPYAGEYGIMSCDLGLNKQYFALTDKTKFISKWYFDDEKLYNNIDANNGVRFEASAVLRGLAIKSVGSDVVKVGMFNNVAETYGTTTIANPAWTAGNISPFSDYWDVTTGTDPYLSETGGVTLLDNTNVEPHPYGGGYRYGYTIARTITNVNIPGKTVSCSFRVRYEEQVNGGDLMPVFAFIRYKLSADGASYVTPRVYDITPSIVDHISGTQTWKACSIMANVPAGATSVQIVIRMNKNYSDTYIVPPALYIDSFSISYYNRSIVELNENGFKMFRSPINKIELNNLQSSVSAPEISSETIRIGNFTLAVGSQLNGDTVQEYLRIYYKGTSIGKFNPIDGSYGAFSGV